MLEATHLELGHEINVMRESEFFWITSPPRSAYGTSFLVTSDNAATISIAQDLVGYGVTTGTVSGKAVTF